MKRCDWKKLSKGRDSGSTSGACAASDALQDLCPTMSELVRIESSRNQPGLVGYMVNPDEQSRLPVA